MANKDTLFLKKNYINCVGTLLDFSIPRVMGILNITPDSFYDGGYYYEQDVAKEQVIKLVEDGADIIDVGGYSTRPGADTIPVHEEWNRLEPVLELIRENFPDVIISVDTFRSEIAGKAKAEYNIDMVNDISAGELDDNMFSTIAELQVPYVMMHMKGNPQNMRHKAQYNDLIGEITAYFAEKVDFLRTLGVKDMIIDPGFGFSKTIAHNFILLRNLKDFAIFNLPLLVGLSRKSMIYKTLDISPQESLNGTTALNTLALLQGADILRVHDVKEARETMRLFDKYKDADYPL
ncbi:MAG: dihydropteroate synthase [Bacteroidales bacterium]